MSVRITDYYVYVPYNNTDKYYFYKKPTYIVNDKFISENKKFTSGVKIHELAMQYSSYADPMLFIQHNHNAIIDTIMQIHEVYDRLPKLSLPLHNFNAESIIELNEYEKVKFEAKCKRLCHYESDKIKVRFDIGGIIVVYVMDNNYVLNNLFSESNDEFDAHKVANTIKDYVNNYLIEFANLFRPNTNKRCTTQARVDGANRHI